MSASETKSCPQCGLPYSSEECPQCARPSGVDDPTILSPDSSSGSSRIATELIMSAALPDTIGPYEILGKLGEGGMGAVYEARQPALDRKVALKVMATRLDHDPTFHQRFETEAKAAAAIAHPNLVHVYDYGEADGCRYIAMEMVEGGSVGQRLKESGKFPPLESIDIVHAAASALQAAGEVGVIHRDIKPDNLLFDKKNRVRVADLGLAKRLDVESNVTRVGTMMGSPYYMAPEQAEDIIHADHRADIYSLGITFFHLITGQRPFTGKTAMKIIESHANDAMPTLADSGVSLPPIIEETIQCMTAKKPTDRFPDYDSLLAALIACRESLQPGGRPLSESTKFNSSGFAPTPPQNPQRDLVFTIAVCVAVLVSALALRKFVKRSQLAQQPQVEQHTTSAPATAAPQSNNVANLPRDHQSIAAAYQPKDFRWNWLPFPSGGPPHPPRMEGTFAENLKKADDFAAENPDKIAQVVMHYRMAHQAEFNSANRAVLQQKLNEWLAKETEAFEKLFRDYDARMRKLAAQKKYREAYEVWADFPNDYPFPRFLRLIWGAITANIPEAELEAILRERNQ